LFDGVQLKIADEIPMLVAVSAVGGKQVLVCANETFDHPTKVNIKIMKRISLPIFVEYLL
jgi:hypothetical protein